MAEHNNTPHKDDAFETLKDAKVIAVVGFSDNPERPSYYVTERVLKKGLHKIYPINPKLAGQEIMGLKVYGSLEEIPEPIDIVNVFRNPAHVEPIVQEAIKLGAKTVWLQPGAENYEVIEKYKDKIHFVYEACIGVEAGYLW